MLDKQRHFVFYLFATFIFLTGCSHEQDEAIRFGMESEPVTLDPRFSTDAASYRITRLIYRSLVDFDDNFQFIPDLADWEMLAPKHYRFKLRNTGRQYHHGERLTADDVKTTYEFVLEASNASPPRGSIAVFDSLEVIDDDTVDFILQHADPLAIDSVSSSL